MRNVLIFFFFQAEDGIRDFHVTGVQTCALPISLQGTQSHPGLYGKHLGPGDLGPALRLSDELGDPPTRRIRLWTDPDEVLLQGLDHLGAVVSAEDPRCYRRVVDAQ